MLAGTGFGALRGPQAGRSLAGDFSEGFPETVTPSQSLQVRDGDADSGPVWTEESKIDWRVCTCISGRVEAPETHTN